MKILVGLLIIIIVFAGCKKNDPANFDIKTLEFTHIDSENVTAKLLHKFPKGIADYEMEITIYFGTDSSGDNPVLDESFYNLDGPVNGQFVENDILLQGLNGDQTYYFSARLYNYEYGIDILTPLSGFTTAPTPNAPCPVISGELNYSGGTTTTGTLTLQPFGDYLLKTSNSLGNFHFNFESEPSSGIYTSVNVTSNLSNSFKTLSIDGVLNSGPFGCSFQVSPGQSFYLHNNDGVIDIEFCDALFSTSGSGCTSEYITGKVSM
jgi:hypothetical protein